MSDDVVAADPPSVEQLQHALLEVHHAILAEARARGWCGEYEDVVRKINEKVGFPALGMRMKRRAYSFSFVTRFRGDENAMYRAYEEFIEYVTKFETNVCEVMSIEAGPSVQTENVDLNAELNTVSEAEMPNRAHPGFRTGACNCPECMDERARTMPARPVRFS